MFNDMLVVTENISWKTLGQLAEQRFGDMVKAVVDVKLGILAVGGELHSDAEVTLLERGSAQEDLWGINLHLDQNPMGQGAHDWIEFDSMINLRPSQGNRSRGVENPETREQIIAIVDRLVTRAKP